MNLHNNDNYRPTARATRGYERRVLSYQEAAGNRPIAPVAVSESVLERPAPKPSVTIKLSFHTPTFEPARALLRRVARLVRPLQSWRVRSALIFMVLVIIATQIIPILQQHLVPHTYALGKSDSLLASKDSSLAAKLKFDAKTSSYNYNADFNAASAGSITNSGGPQIKAIANRDPAQGLQVVDPINNSTFTIKPQFALMSGKQDGNRLIYPMLDGTGWVVYTMLATSVKEDVILNHANGDKMQLKYQLDIASQGLEARLQADGSVGVYGSSSPLGGNVTTGNDQDAALLQKARQNAPKDKALFSLPTPIVYAANHVVSQTVHTTYQLKDDRLTTVTTGLKAKGTSFPLDIDPAVTVIGSSDLFRDTNADSNIDLNASNGAINRGNVTGGTLPAFTQNASSSPVLRGLVSSAIYDDYAYVAGGSIGASTANNSTVHYARMGNASQTDYTIGTWAATTSLPVSLSRFQLLAYNGYLYAIGGSVGDNSCTTVSAKIYFNRIQTNGQLSSNWTDNSSLPGAVSLPAGVCGLGATISNNILYIAGGRTGAATSNGVTTVAHAPLNPDGSVGSFVSDTAITARYDADVRVYNGYIYIIGGMLAGTPTNTILYAALNSTGAVYNTTWSSAANLFTTARGNFGSSFTTISDGYIYLSGGCQTFSANQSCSTILSDTQIAQINADGTIGSWSTDAVAPLSRAGASLASWRGTVYSFSGCTAMSSNNVQCSGGNALATQQYSHITDPGQIGPRTTAANTFTTGRYEHASVIVNGYIYVIGGCITADGTNSCQISGSGNANTTSTTYYAPILANGNVGTFTLDTRTGFNSAKGGLAAMGVATYNGYIYLMGGYDYADGAVSTVYYAQTSATGGLTAAGWQTTSNISGTSGAKYGMSAFAYRGYIYSIGGCSNAANGAGCLTNSYVTTVQRAQVTVSTGALGAWSTANLTQLPAGRGLTGLAIYNSYVYLAGGGTSANGGQDSGVLYAKLTATGTITTAWATATGGMTTNGTTALALRRTDAYAMNGYLYVTGGHSGATGLTYGTVQIGKINLATGNIDSNLAPSVTTITARWDARTVFANGYMYVSGGCTNGGPPASCATGNASTTLEYVEIYNAGNKGTSTWNSANNASVQKTGAAVTAYNGYLYSAGGCTAYTVSSSTCTTFSNTVSYAPLNPDGTIGTWVTTGVGSTIGTATTDSCLVGSGGYLYLVGGRVNSTTASSTVYASQIGSSGAPGAWGTGSTTLTTALAGLSCGVFNDRIYTTGGALGNGTAQSLVYYSSSQSSGGNVSSWTSATAFTTPARYSHSTVVAGGYLYVMGGYSGSAYLQDVQYIQLVPSGGTTGSWIYATDLPLPIQQQSAISANGYIYLFGGRTATTTCSPSTWIASVNSTGTTSNWSTAINNFTTPRFGEGATFYGGYYYTVGGNDCTNTITSANTIQYGGEQSQAMTATFSKYADLNGNGDPQKLVIYLTNAQLNSVDIEKWNMTYVSSREAANSWGQATVINPLVDENAYNVNAYDGSGVDQTVSRWFYLSFSIDMTQSFTFTDDTQPKITQYGLHYSPPPAKRLLHGRDFRDQTQQGEDLKL